MQVLNTLYWGLISYAEALNKQEELMQSVIDRKLLHRDDSIANPNLAENYLVLCEHMPVYTLGNKAKIEHLLLKESELESRKIELYKTRRGGDITYHGPGQLIVYPILDLDQFFTDIHRYLRLLEETIIRTLSDLGIKAGRIEGLTGVWVGMDAVGNHYARKICAIGVRCSRWVTQHGLALNVNTELNNFSGIVPCGISDHGVTSIEKELGRVILMETVEDLLINHFKTLFLS